jgi:anti-sigma B factor antagonist
MASVKAELSIQRSTNARGAVLSLAGELDASSAHSLEKELRALQSEGQGHIRLDLGGLSFVDSAGVSVLVKAKREASERGDALILSRPTPQVHGVFSLLGLVQWLSYDEGAG